MTDPEPAPEAEAALAGSLRLLPFPDVLRALAGASATGVLHLRVGVRAPERKAVWFRDGQVVFAASTDPADHLGTILWRRGIAQLEDIERLSAQVRPGHRLGQVLVDGGVLAPTALYEALVEQVREIVLGAFHERHGAFTFHERVAPERTAVQLPERTRDLVAAGLRRVADVERLGVEVPDPDSPLVAPAALPPGIEPRAARLLAFADGTRTPREAFRASGLGFHDGMKVLAALARAGLVAGPPVLRPVHDHPREPGPGEELEAFDAYRRAVKRMALRLAPVAPAARQRLNAWFDALDPADREAFDGVRVRDDGELDAARVLLNVFAAGHEEGAAARARAIAALDRFVAFAVFEARNLLADADADALAREVDATLGRSA